MTQKIVRLACSLVMVVAIAACGNDGGNGAVLVGFKARGGKGLSGAGGTGGTIQVRSRQGGSVAVLRTGGIPTLPVLQEPAAPDLGTNPRTISADVTIESSSFPLLGDDGTTAATGLWVQSGKTLTFTLSDISATKAELTLTGGLRVDGTVRTSPLPTGVPAGLTLRAKTVAIGSSGLIDLSGADATDTGSGFAGANCALIAQEGIFSQGQVAVRGGRGGSSGAGGAGGKAVLATETGSILNTGTLDSSGGEGQGGAGGAGGASQLGCIGATSTGEVLNTGRLISRGANGKTSGGGGGTVMNTGCQIGRVMSSGVVDASGGNATEDGPGGGGGEITVAAYSSQVFVAGQVLASGGKGISNGAGGKGGKAQLWVAKTDTTPASQGVFLTAEIDVSGGEGATGGDAGEASLDEAESDLSDPPGTTMVISGHQSLDASGGQGATNGGGGGQLFVASMRNSGATARIGSVTSELPLYANGGQGLAGDGGSAGTIGVGTDNTAPEDIAILDRALTVTGAMFAVGGEGSVTGGAGGTFIVHEHFNLDLRGAIDASGGRGGSAKGGDGGSADIAGEGMVSTPVINASGGASQTNQGGEGGTVTVSGVQVTVASAITLDGGAGGGSFGGGGGGDVSVTGTTEAHVTAVCSVRAGASSLPGTLGQVTINGVIQTLVDGQYRP